MAIKKSDLYSSIWQSCDELRGGMDASQYKDYVLFMLFIKYITDKYGDSTDFAPPVINDASLRHAELRGLRFRRQNQLSSFSCCGCHGWIDPDRFGQGLWFWDATNEAFGMTGPGGLNIRRRWCSTLWVRW